MSNKRETFWYLMVSDILHTILLGLFIYVYSKAEKESKKTSVLGMTVDTKARRD